MKITVPLGGVIYRCDLEEGREISIPLRFGDRQPRAFGAPVAASEAFRTGTFVGDVREGGSCNCDAYSIVPHCNGTHTECVGHITTERIGIAERLQDILFPCTVISVRPENALTCRESYIPDFQAEDPVITASALGEALAEVPAWALNGLVIRTLPNVPAKREQDYTEEPFPFCSNEAMRLIRARGVEHLLLDTPSADRAADEGRLSNHRIFWDLEAGSTKDLNGTTRTITEMVFVPDDVEDGLYFASIQIPHFMTDAAPSRVWLFKLTTESGAA